MSENSVHILVVEDENLIRESLKDSLVSEGYQVTLCSDGLSGLEAFRANVPSLVILDVMMPGTDGLEACRQMRALEPTVPIIMLTAKSEEIDKVVGLEIGADDYLTKPFGMRELFARVKALLRRASAVLPTNKQQVDQNLRLDFDDIKIDFKTYRATKDGLDLEFSAKEFELLRYLSSQPDIPVTRSQLLDEVWGYNSYPTTRTVDNFIARLRHKIEQVPDDPKHILTVYGVGYKFVF